MQFVLSAYASTYAVFLITGGRIGDLFGRRKLFLLGVAGFSIGAGDVPSFWMGLAGHIFR